MMVLRSSPASPFGRKVKIALSVLGLKDKVDVQFADTNDATDILRRQNPLGKIPTLILENGQALFDSRVIVEYLDHLAGGGRIFPSGPKRFAALVAQALADGVMEAALLQVYEGRYRDPSRIEPKWLGMQAGRVERALSLWESAPPAIDATPDIGTIATACALGYLDLRFNGEWRKDFPKMTKWLDGFAAKVPAFEETRVAA